MGTLWMFLALLVLAAACDKISFELGPKVTDLEVLEEALILGQSTPEDVRAVLGEPTGDGAVMLPILDSKPRTAWSYYHTESQFVITDRGSFSGDNRLMLLLIYFDNDRYDGYMWFSSVPEHEDEFKRLGGTVVK